MTLATTDASTLFRCTPGGAVAAGRRRIRRLLLGAALVMLALAVVVLITGRWGPALLCVGGAFLCFFAWQMSGDLDPFWLTIERGMLTVQMRRQRAELALSNVLARKLTPEERAHLALLASAGGVTFASASFESLQLGAFDLHATNLDNAVMVETDASPEEIESRAHRSHLDPPSPLPPSDRTRWIVTPDEPERLIAALSARRAP